MSKGILVFARNNDQIDYIKQAYALAKRAKKHLNLPTSIATDSVNYLKKQYGTDTFDKVIEILPAESPNKRHYNDGTLISHRTSFKNFGRSLAYDISPYNETLVLDTDFIICNDIFKNCFNSQDDFLIYKDSHDITQVRDESEFDYVSDSSIEMYWATCLFFRKTETNKIFFDLVQHIEKNYNHYRRVYQITSSMYRNDHAFSIAIHMMNGFQEGDFAKSMPGKLLYTLDRDLLWEIQGDDLLFLAEKKKYLGEYTPIKTRRQNIHVMNKFSLNREIDKELLNE